MKITALPLGARVKTGAAANTEQEKKYLYHGIYYEESYVNLKAVWGSEIMHNY